MAVKAERRRFTAEYKQKVLREADDCERPGEIGPSLEMKFAVLPNDSWSEYETDGKPYDAARPGISDNKTLYAVGLHFENGPLIHV